MHRLIFLTLIIVFWYGAGIAAYMVGYYTTLKKYWKEYGVAYGSAHFSWFQKENPLQWWAEDAALVMLFGPVSLYMILSSIENPCLYFRSPERRKEFVLLKNISAGARIVQDSEGTVFIEERKWYGWNAYIVFPKNTLPSIESYENYYTVQKQHDLEEGLNIPQSKKYAH